MNPFFTPLNRAIKKTNANLLSISGVDNSFIAAQNILKITLTSDNPTLVVVPSDKEYLDLEKAFKFLDSTYKIKYLPHFSSQLYSEITPPARLVHSRLNWLFTAMNSSGFDKLIFVATRTSLMQKTLPMDLFIESSFDLQVNSEIPKNFSRTLSRLGYQQSPLAEDPGTFAFRGGILDIFSSAHDKPIRIELFGDVIESIKFYNPENQRSEDSIIQCSIIPAKEALFTDENRQRVAQSIKASASIRNIDSDEIKEQIQDVIHWKYFLGSDSIINYFYEKETLPNSYLPNKFITFNFDPQSQIQVQDKFLSTLKEHYKYNFNLAPILPKNDELFSANSDSILSHSLFSINLFQILLDELNTIQDDSFTYISNDLKEFKQKCKDISFSEIGDYLQTKIKQWKDNKNSIFICSESEGEQKQFKLIAEDHDINFDFIEQPDIESIESQAYKQEKDPLQVTVINKECPETIHLKSEGLIFIKLSHLFGKKSNSTKKAQVKDFKRAKSLHFGDLKPNDFIVHKEHGVGVYKGLTKMELAGVEAEFLQLEYKGKDKLYLPIYRIGQIQKFTGAGSGRIVDKLGGTGWAKTKTKVKSKVKDIASDLLKLYAERNQSKRPALPPPSSNYNKFAKFFPYSETDDQLNAINHILNDQTLDKPMDRLVCGDVGFGKTEVAMRAAFRAANNGQQVAVIAPTTILTFQHFETFKKRFASWPFKICCLNRFVSASETKKNIRDIKSGEARIIIGTHRLFSKDIDFYNLGLLIIDEEQKFGVKHKEKIRSLKASVDTLTLSATPIPRTLNMSFLGIRDLSLINTAPVDRLPVRTFVSKYEIHTIKKAITNEVDRGGQVFFLHNRVNNIETIASELKAEMPNIRFAIGHGQMNETELEKVMVSFYEKKIDVLISTTIIESGMDIPNANTIIINNAQNLGLSQLYQLRGRVGRSTKRAYCYLMIPQTKVIDKQAIERLKVIQQNSELGSGITIAQYDLELRGSGDLLGESQSGHINAVGYELYMDLLKEAINEQKGEVKTINQLEPEINLKIPGLFPDKYMSDIRLRLSYYKRLSDIESIEDIDHIEEELRDQFGKPPLEVQNLLGIMLIRLLCKKLYIKDLSQGKKGITLQFTADTPLSTEQVFKLSSRADQKYKLTPESKLLVHMKEKSWERTFEELSDLAKYAKLSI